MQVFLLSPALLGGVRGRLVRRREAGFDLAARLRERGAPVGEVFEFVSGLYFRGKLAYTAAFADPPAGLPGALVVAAGRGLLAPEAVVTIADLEEMATVPVDADEPRYREPLERDARKLAAETGCRVVLLGSLASAKYVEPLAEIFGERLCFPAEFVGRGDLSRGGLMLRAARAGRELEYIPALGAKRHGKRPPRLGR